MTKKKINIWQYFIPTLIVISFLARVLFVVFYRDVHIDNEWGVLLDSLIKDKTYSYYKFYNEPIPSAYMPPLYVFFLYFIKIITSFEKTSFVNSIIFLQIIFSTYSVYLFYKINKNFFPDWLSYINSSIFSLIPINVYICGQISSINLQIFLSLLFLRFLLLILEEKSRKNIFVFSIISGLLILTRGEFILIFIFIFLFTFFKKKLTNTNLIQISLIILLVISPFVIRNYVQFNQIFIVKSLGYNLWKGNNELSAVGGQDYDNKIEFVDLQLKLNKIEKNKFYEINRDNIFLAEAITNLKDDPLRYFKLFVKKFFSYYFIEFDSKHALYYNFFHIFPIVILSILSFPGLFIFYRKKKSENQFLLLYLILNLFIFSLFFILPRYKLIILPVQIILAAQFLEYFLKKININISDKQKDCNEYKFK